MTPLLQQAIKLLQLSNLDLTVYVEGELEQNPLLERVEADGPAAAGTGDEAAGDAPRDPVSDLGADYDNMWSSDGVGVQSPVRSRLSQYQR